MECIKCHRKNIKYRCIGCKIPICNVCSVACSEKTPGYCEQSYFVGKCDECQTSSSKKRPFSEPQVLDKPRQSTLSSFFIKNDKTPSGNKESALADTNSGTLTKESPQSESTSGQRTLTTNKSRNLTAAAANRWKTTSLATYMASDWLVLNADNADCVTSLNCSVGKTYADRLKGMKNFSTAWAFTGSTNLRLSNAEDHARGEPHKKAMDLYLSEKGLSATDRAEFIVKSTPGQQNIALGIANMQASDLAKTRTKFEVAYFIAKEELPLKKFPKLLKLEEKHGVEIGNSYRSDNSCNVFINHIGEDLGKNLQKKLLNVNFFSVLTDGSEDASTTEKEAVFVQHLDKKPPGRDTVQVVTSFLNLADLKHGNAAGILGAIKSSFKNIDIDDETFDKKLIGFAADGASVNRGDKNGVISILRNNHPWVIYVWCVAHRLELALKDALQGTSFDDVDQVLLRLYYLYENSSKKLRQLRERHGIYRETFEFEEGGVRPKRASGKFIYSFIHGFHYLLLYLFVHSFVYSFIYIYIYLYVYLFAGTRWITHKINALQLLVDKYGIYLQHLQNMSEDMSFKAADCQKFKGWLNKWQQARIPLLACLFIEILSPAKVLSLAFQDEDIDTVSSLSRLETAKKQFIRIEKKEFEDLPTVSRFLDKVEESNEAFSYQNVVLKSFENAKESARKLKNVLLAKVKQAVEARLEVAENRLACTVLNTEGWERMDEEGEKDLLFADECVTELYSHFQKPLSNAGLDGSLSDLLEQWHSVIEYTTRYLSPSTTPYLRVWRRIFDSSRSEGWSMVLLLAELLFSIPISNAKVERLFSLMNRIKTDSRATLGESTLNSLIRISMEGPKFE